MLPDGYYKEPITVRQLIEQLQKLPEDMNVFTVQYDSEYGGAYYNYVTGVGGSGCINSGLTKLDRWIQDDEEFEDEDEYNEEDD